MDRLKKIVYIGTVIMAIALAILLAISIQRGKKIEKEWKEAEENVKAYSSEFSSLRNKNVAYKLTIEQLEYFQDSIFQELNKTRKDLKVKNSKLESLQYVSSTFTKADTIILKDTIFKDPQVKVDTVLSDEWYSLKLGLRYPSTIAASPKFRSIKHIVVSSKRETVNPPSKIFFIRWFQRKHTVLNIDIVEKNPYVAEESSRYVEILK